MRKKKTTEKPQSILELENIKLHQNNSSAKEQSTADNKEQTSITGHISKEWDTGRDKKARYRIFKTWLVIMII